MYFAVAIVSDRYTKRFLPLIIFAPITAIGYAILLSPVSPAVHYFATYLVATGCYICAGINFSWLTSNSAPDGKRAASVGVQQTIAQLAGVISGQIYPSTEAPRYVLGHAFSLGSICVAWAGWWVLKYILETRETEKEVTRSTDGVYDGPWDDRAPEFKYQM